MGKELEYNEANKKAFHSEGKKVLKALAKMLDLEPGTFSVRSCLGGIAVAGEVILHTEHAYIVINKGCGQSNVMFRSCKGQKDFCGGPNRWTKAENLLSKSFIRTIMSITDNSQNVA
jgi:hypothetical protein